MDLRDELPFADPRWKRLSIDLPHLRVLSIRAALAPLWTLRKAFLNLTTCMRVDTLDATGEPHSSEASGNMPDRIREFWRARTGSDLLQCGEWKLSSSTRTCHARLTRTRDGRRRRYRRSCLGLPAQSQAPPWYSTTQHALVIVRTFFPMHPSSFDFN
jgi:hypothetical protein